MLAHVVAVVFLYNMFSLPKCCILCECNCLLRFMQVGTAASKSCQKMFFIRCIAELSGSIKTFSSKLVMGRHSQHAVPRASERLGSDWKIDDELLSRKREMQQDIVVAMEAKMAKSKSVVTPTWPAACKSKKINGMISFTTSSSDNRPKNEEAPQQRNHIAKRCSIFF